MAQVASAILAGSGTNAQAAEERDTPFAFAVPTIVAPPVAPPTIDVREATKIIANSFTPAMKSTLRDMSDNDFRMQMSGVFGLDE